MNFFTATNFTSNPIMAHTLCLISIWCNFWMNFVVVHISLQIKLKGKWAEIANLKNVYYLVLSYSTSILHQGILSLSLSLSLSLFFSPMTKILNYRYIQLPNIICTLLHKKCFYVEINFISNYYILKGKNVLIIYTKEKAVDV